MPQTLKNSNGTYNTDVSEFYDRMNQHRGYDAQIERLERFIRQHVTSARPRILDVGCGTGLHSVRLSTLGYDMTAIDLSPDMIRVAKKKKADVHFSAGDVGQLKASDFEFAYSLGNVVNCLNSLDELTLFFRNIADRLQEEALFLVDSWNPIAVIAEPPRVVERSYEGPNDRIVRKVTPFPDFFRQRLDLRYDTDVFGNAEPEKKLHSFSVIHNLLLFTPLEIDFCLQRAGFADVKAYTALPYLTPATASDRMLAFTGRKTNR